MAPLKSRLQHSFTPIALRSYLAEFISTFLFVFASVGAATSSCRLRYIYIRNIFVIFPLAFYHVFESDADHECMYIYIGKMTPAAASDPASLTAIAVASAFSLAAAVYIAADISGGHVNPAVTFGMAVGGHITVPMAVFYWIAQMLASVMACLLIKTITVGQVSC